MAGITTSVYTSSLESEADQILRLGTSASEKSSKFISFSEQTLESRKNIAEGHEESRWRLVEKLSYQYSLEYVSGRLTKDYVVNRLSELAASERRRYGANSAVSFVEGVDLFLRGSEEEAQYAFLDSSSFPLKRERFHISRGASNFRSSDWLAKLSDPYGSYESFKPLVNFTQSKGEATELVHLTSADSIYFQKFGSRFAYESSERGGTPHIHLVNPHEQDWKLAENLQKLYGVRFSFEESEFVKRIPFSKGYLINPRYMITPEVMSHYDSSVLVTDIDSAPNCSFREILLSSEGFDAKLRILAGEKGGGIPWKRVAAGGNLFINTSGGFQLAQFVSRYITHLISYFSDRNGWLLDQNALSTSAELASQMGLKIDKLLVNGKTPIVLAQAMEGGKESFVV